MKIQTIKTDDPLQDPRVLAVRDRLRRGLTAEAGMASEVERTVREILADVQARSDMALVEWERRLDGAELTAETLRVPEATIRAAHQAADADFLELVRRVTTNIRAFQEGILAPGPAPLRRGGRDLRVRYEPIGRVGMYVPAGKAIYPSSMLMTLVPAQVAGVPRIALASPPRSDGDVHPMMLAIAAELGVTEVYRLGGAVAIAALAMGTAHVRAVDKVVGPGNAFVTEAKRQVFGRVGIDSMAGPSEVLIVADETAPPAWVAADLLAQAEHNPGAAILVTTSAGLAETVLRHAKKQVVELKRAEPARRCLEEYGAVIIVPDLDAACAVASELACEHVQVMTADDEAVVARIRNAGAVFAGPWSPVALGDYHAGPSHVLPTGGTARFFSPLSCNEFRRSSSIIRCDARAVAEDAADVAAFAELEALTGHAQAVRMRGGLSAED